MGLIAWTIFGAIAGWVASMIVGRNRSQGWIGNIVVGIVGALIGGWIFSLIQGHGFAVKWSIGSFVVAVIGAVVLLAILNAIPRAAGLIRRPHRGVGSPRPAPSPRPARSRRALLCVCAAAVAQALRCGRVGRSMRDAARLLYR